MKTAEPTIDFDYQFVATDNSLEIMGKEDGDDVTVWRCRQCR
jgi:hypothetical protein